MLTIIGIGSPMTGDKLGWQVIDQLQQYSETAPFTPDQLQLIKLDRPGSGLLDYLDVENKVIVIDAIISEQHGFGELIRLNAQQLIESAPDNQQSQCSAQSLSQLSLLSSHGFGLKEALQLAKQLKRLPQDCLIMGLNLYPQAVKNAPSNRDPFTTTLDINLSLLIEQLAAEIRQRLCLSRTIPIKSYT